MAILVSGLALQGSWAHTYSSVEDVGPDSLGFAFQKQRLQIFLEEYSELDPYLGSEDIAVRIDSTRAKILEALWQVLNQGPFPQEPLDEDLWHREIQVVKSLNGQLYCYTIDHKTGGSYKPASTILHHRRRDGIFAAHRLDDCMGQDVQESNINEVYTLDSLGTAFLLLGTLQTCNTCFVASAFTVSVDEEGFHFELVAQIKDFNDETDQLFFDSKSSILHFAETKKSEERPHEEKKSFYTFQFLGGAGYQVIR
jgi:hypothetical protein